MEKYPITKKGYEKLELEYKNLKQVERPAIIEQISAARDHGDLKENAEYHSAREKQGFIEGRITELEDITARAQIIDTEKLSGEKVVFGAEILLVDVETDEEKTYQIVSEYEANIENSKISLTSPIARGLIGKSIGDEALIKTPGGNKQYEILEVNFK